MPTARPPPPLQRPRSRTPRRRVRSRDGSPARRSLPERVQLRPCAKRGLGCGLPLYRFASGCKRSALRPSAHTAGRPRVRRPSGADESRRRSGGFADGQHRRLAPVGRQPREPKAPHRRGRRRHARGLPVGHQEQAACGSERSHDEDDGARASERDYPHVQTSRAAPGPADDVVDRSPRPPRVPRTHRAAPERPGASGRLKAGRPPAETFSRCSSGTCHRTRLFPAALTPPAASPERISAARERARAPDPRAMIPPRKEVGRCRPR